jgi:hypothetical protein
MSYFILETRTIYGKKYLKVYLILNLLKVKMMH